MPHNSPKSGGWFIINQELIMSVAFSDNGIGKRNHDLQKL
jgi:hypothetical protein